MDEQQERKAFEKDWREREGSTLYCESAWRGWKAKAASTLTQPNATDAVTRAVIEVEKLLCEKLGKQWRPSGMCIESLVEELAMPPTQAAHTSDESAFVKDLVRDWSTGVKGSNEVCITLASRFRPAPAKQHYGVQVTKLLTALADIQELAVAQQRDMEAKIAAARVLVTPKQ